MNHGDYFNWTCDVCGFSDFDKDEEYFVGHRWDCLESQDNETYEEDEND